MPAVVPLPRSVVSIFPRFEPIRSLTVLDARHYRWDKQLTTLCLQGLVNRREPRLYLILDDRSDRFWLEEYRRRYRIPFMEAADLFEVLPRFAGELDGYVLYDESLLHSANLAMTFGSLHRLLPASEAMAARLQEAGLRQRDDFRGRWKGRLEAYRWACDNLLPRANRRIAGSVCVDPGEWRQYQNVRDYLTAAGALAFDLSPRRRDREECALFDRILSSLESPSMLLGWHCFRSHEAEYVARAATHGCFVICSHVARNLTVHAAIRTRYRPHQHHEPPEQVRVEDKVYLAFATSDGDNISDMCTSAPKDWADPQRGTVPIAWTVQPLALHLAPGVMEHYYRTATENDELIAGPSGAGYTAPTLFRDRQQYLRMGAAYLERCDLSAVYLMNRDPVKGFRQDLEDPDLIERMAAAWDGCVGFLHEYAGMMLTGHRPAAFPSGKPYLKASLFVQSATDVGAAIDELVDRCPWRPLFVAVHVRGGMVGVPDVRRAVEVRDPAKFEVVRLERFLRLVARAKEEGRFREAAPQGDQLPASWRGQARRLFEEQAAWLRTLRRAIGREGEALRLAIDEEGVFAGASDFTLDQLADMVTFRLCEAAFALVQAALKAKGMSAILRREAVGLFLGAYREVPGTGVVEELLGIWERWETTRTSMDEARRLFGELDGLSSRLEPPIAGS